MPAPIPEELENRPARMGQLWRDTSRLFEDYGLELGNDRDFEMLEREFQEVLWLVRERISGAQWAEKEEKP